MSTVEKLFVQIFERNTQIKQQVKQQTELYLQNLASKFLLNGIDPPPWLWNPNQSSSDVPKVLNKEELISELFLPRPQHPVGFYGSQYCPYNQSATYETAEILDRSSKAIDACSNSSTGARQARAVAFEEDNAGCGTNVVPEVEVRVTSPKDRSSKAIDACCNSYSGARQALAVAFEEDNAGCGTNAVSEVQVSVTSSKVRSSKAIDQCNNFDSGARQARAVAFEKDNAGCGTNDVPEVQVSVTSPNDKSSKASDACRNSDSGTRQVNAVAFEEHNAGCGTNAVSEVQVSITSSKDRSSKAIDQCNSIDSGARQALAVAFEEDNAGCGTNAGPDVHVSVTSPKNKSSKAIDACSNSESGARKACAVAFGEDNAGCGTNYVPEVEVSATSPADGTELRISNAFAAQKHSLLRIQRSKSRQKALEQRTSSKAKRKNLSQEPTLAVSSAKDRLSFIRKEVDLVNGMEHLGNCFVISHESCDNENLNEGNSREKENEVVFAASYNRRSSNSAAGATFSSNGLKPDCLDIPENDRTEEVMNREILSFHTMGDFCTSNADNSQVPVQCSTPTLKQGEPDLEDHVDLKDRRISPINISTLNITPNYSEVQVQSASHKANHVFNASNISGSENYMSISLEDGSRCIPELDIAKYQRTLEGKDKSTSVPHGIEVERVEMDYCASKDNLDMIGSVSDDREPSKACEIQFLEKLQSGPSNKRTKFEKEASSFSSSPGFRTQIEPWTAITSNTNVQGESEAVLGQSTVVDNCEVEQINQTLSYQLTKSMEDSLEYMKNESRSHSVVLSEHGIISASPNLIQAEESILVTSATEVHGVPQGSLSSELDLAEGSFHARRNQKSDHEDEALVNTEALIDRERNINNGSRLVFDRGLSGKLDQSPAKHDLGQTMPVIEGFIMDHETSNEKVGTPQNEITFDELELPKISIECSSLMEKVCKSASMQTPQILSIFKSLGIPACHQSVPNGLLECAGMNRFSVSNGHVYGHSDGTKKSFQEMYFDSLPYSKNQYSRDLQNPFASPVGNLWDKISLHRESSGNRSSSKPEFECFPIKEDPDSGDENEDIPVPESVNKNDDTVVSTWSERNPLAAYSSGTSSVLAAEKCADKSSLDSVAADGSFKQTDKKSNVKLQKRSMNRNTVSGNDIQLIGEKGKKNSVDSTNKIYGKLSTYGNSSRTKQRKLSVKVPKQNNIVSNVTSFIPLVQQKKDAALCKGQRDIKVKALGAAKAAKQQQEKRDQERKLRTEKLKQNRERVEREDLRLVEINKKKKEEERKKKDAEVAAKKRAREEAEKFERDKKRKRMEETKKQGLHEGKSLFDKGKQLSILVTPAMKSVEMNNVKQKVRETSYEISPYQDSDVEEGSDDVLSDRKAIPSWARKSCVALVLRVQHENNPSLIFPADSFCSTSEVVAPRRLRLGK